MSSRLGFYALVALTGGLMAAALWQIFGVAPTEAIMGIVQKIFYFHVPSAYCMYLGATVCFVGSAWYIGTGNDKGDALAQAGAELAVAFGWIVIVTGPLWARKAWGTYWTWDPRLTTTLLGALIFVAYLVLHGSAGAGEAEKKFSSAVAVMGAAVMPVIHFSVTLWRGQHPTVITRQGGGLAPEMARTLGLGFLAFTVLSAALLVLRARVALQESRLDALRTEAVSRGMLDEVT